MSRIDSLELSGSLGLYQKIEYGLSNPPASKQTVWCISSRGGWHRPRQMRGPAGNVPNHTSLCLGHPEKSILSCLFHKAQNTASGLASLAFLLKRSFPNLGDGTGDLFLRSSKGFFVLSMLNRYATCLRATAKVALFLFP